MEATFSSVMTEKSWSRSRPDRGFGSVAEEATWSTEGSAPREVDDGFAKDQDVDHEAAAGKVFASIDSEVVGAEVDLAHDAQHIESLDGEVGQPCLVGRLRGDRVSARPGQVSPSGFESLCVCRPERVRVVGLPRRLRSGHGQRW